MEDFKSKGRKAFGEKNYQEAARIYDKAIHLDPDDAVLFSNRAQCFINLQDWNHAMKDCEEGLRKNPILKIREKLLYRGAIAAKSLNQISLAMSWLHQLLEISPSNQAAKSVLEELKKILGDSPSQTSSKKLKTSLNGGQVPIEVVDALPERYSKIVNFQSQSPSIPKRAENMELVEKVSQELLLDRPAKDPSRSFQAKKFAERPAMLQLKGLDQLLPKLKHKAFKTILGLKEYEILELGDVEPEFFELFIDSVAYGIESDYANPDELLNKLKVILSLPRYQIALHKCSQQKITNLLEKLKHALPHLLLSFNKLLS